MTITIRRLENGDELAEIVRKIGGYSFGETPPLNELDQTREYLESRKNGRMLVLFEDDAPLVVAGSAPMTQNVRGKIYENAGIYSVAAWPKARRKGYTRQLMIEMLNQERERGAPISGLYPFRESFYERMGYTLFPMYWQYQFPVSVLRPVLKFELPGEVDVLPMAEAYDTYYDFMHTMQKHIHGLSLFDDLRMSGYRDRNKEWVAVARVDDEVVGLMTYKINGYEKPIVIDPFLYTNMNGRYLLLEWLARHIDQVSEVHVQLPPTDSPAIWLSDIAQQLKAERPFRVPMGRVLDIEKIGGMQVGTGAVTIRVNDPHFDWNCDVFRFESDNGTLKVTRGGTPDCELTIHGLSAWIYGTHDPALYALRGWGTPSENVQAQMLALLPPATPYVHQYY